nr:postacrosomal sheath WW domain-binding protein-like [Rhipicephalus microplus]
MNSSTGPGGSSLSGRLFVGGLDSTMTRDDLEREFGKYGQLKEVWMAQNPPGFAFVEFEHMSSVDEAVREMNGAIVNGALLRVERARDKSRPARWVAPNGGGVGPFRPRLRRGGGAGAAAGSYHQAGLERKMMRRVPESTAAPSPQETTAPMQAGYTDGAAPGAPAYGYDYAATAAMADPYAAPPAYAPGLPAVASWESPYGTTYYATPVTGYAAPAPGYAAPAPGYAAPAPGYAAPEPGYAAPEPGYDAPEPGYAAPEPGYAAPEPGYVAPEPGYVAPEPGYVAPTPGYAAPAPGYMAPAPRYMAPAPGYMAPAPGYVPYYGEYYGMPANMPNLAVAPVPVADPVAAPYQPPPDYGQA